MGRIFQSAVREAREKGIKVGLLRPITLWPFPTKRISELAAKAKGILVVEMNAGQMLEDVRLAALGSCPDRFCGRFGGVIPLPDEILEGLDWLIADVDGSKEGHNENTGSRRDGSSPPRA